MLNKLLGRTEGHSPQGASWRDALPNAEKTAPPGLMSSVRKMPVDVAVKSAARANDRVTSAEGDLMRAELALEQLRRENAETEALHLSYVEKRKAALDTAKVEREQAHIRMLNEIKDVGALEGCRYVDFKSMNDGKDDDKIPTVRVEIE